VVVGGARCRTRRTTPCRGIVKYWELFPGRNCQIIGLGPSEESQAHTSNEYMSIARIRKAFQGYAGSVSEPLMRP